MFQPFNHGWQFQMSNILPPCLPPHFSPDLCRSFPHEQHPWNIILHFKSKPAGEKVLIVDEGKVRSMTEGSGWQGGSREAFFHPFQLFIHPAAALALREPRFAGGQSSLRERRHDQGQQVKLMGLPGVKGGRPGVLFPVSSVSPSLYLLWLLSRFSSFLLTTLDQARCLQLDMFCALASDLLASCFL